MVEKQIVTKLIEMLDEAGWKLKWVSEEDFELTVKDSKEALETIFDLEQPSIIFQKNGRTHGVLLIPGNGVDIVSDYSFNPSDDFDAVLKKHGEWVAENFY